MYRNTHIAWKSYFVNLTHLQFLFRAYKFILTSGNSEILMNYAHLDEITEVKDVFTDLKKYIVKAS